MKAKAFLGRAYRLDIQIHSKLEQVEQLRALACKVTNSISPDKVSARNTSTGAFENSIVKLIMTEQSLNETINRLIEVKNEIADTIAMLKNEDERLLLELRYMCFYSWENIASKMRVSLSYAFRLHRRAENSIDGILKSKGCDANE